ncbi:MAG TPA: hypothetical protein G4N96_06060, partial [Chloroflexi bacterium]|nr:hypothetical protein [Chloroflexota bacterium]
ILAQSTGDTIQHNTATSTASPPPTLAAFAATASISASAVIPSPAPTPIGGMQWEGVVTNTAEGPSIAGALLRVKVKGMTGLPVDIATVTDFVGQGVTGSKPQDLAADELEFAGLSPGQYIITPHGIFASLTVNLAVNTTTWVEFRQIVPPTPTPTFTPRPPTATPTATATPRKAWMASLTQNTNRAIPGHQADSTITILVKRQRGQNVTLADSRGQTQTCKTNVAYQCRFAGLKAGVYTVALPNLDSQYSLYVDGAGEATITFSQEIVAQNAPVATAIIGQGAIPRKTQRGMGVVKATPSATATSPPTPTRRPTITPAPASATPTATATPPPTSTPTPAMAWIGEVAQNFAHPGQTLIVRAPLGNHPVIIKSGGWQTEGLTGAKAEYGDGAVEFAGLSPGTYIIELVGLGETSVDLEAEHFMLVQFNYQPAPTPTSTPKPGQWTAAIISNTSGSQPGGGAWSILTIEVGGRDNLKVSISSQGTQLECITGSKPELGPGVCEIGGLWPAKYHIQPAGIPASLDIELDGRGVAYVAFWQQ